MAIICGIDYGDLIFSERHELDKQAYTNYYNDYFGKGSKTYNNWYGTKSHVKYITKLVRKLKLEKIRKLNEIDD